MESTFSLLVVEALVEEGVYQCRVFNNNGENSMETEVIDARRELHGLLVLSMHIHVQVMYWVWYVDCIHLRHV